MLSLIISTPDRPRGGGDRHDVAGGAHPDLRPNEALMSENKPRLNGFEFLQCLGRGAFGEVWLARDLTLDTLPPSRSWPTTSSASRKYAA